MKIQLIIFLLFMTQYAQENPFGWSQAEIFIITRGLSESGSDSLRYRMSAVGDIYKADETAPFSNFQKTNAFNQAFYPRLIYPGVKNTPDSYFNTPFILGFNFVFASQNPDNLDSYGWGLYKLTAIHRSEDNVVTERGCIYLNYRIVVIRMVPRLPDTAQIFGLSSTNLGMEVLQ